MTINKRQQSASPDVGEVTSADVDFITDKSRWEALQ